MIEQPFTQDDLVGRSAAPVVVSLFGPLTLTVNGKEVTRFRSNKTRALLTYLLLEQPQPLLRSTISKFLWPGYTDQSAQANLRQTVADLRKVLAPFDLIESSRTQLSLRRDPTVLWCDVHAFERLIERCRVHEHTSLSDCQACHARRQAAIALYTAPLLKPFTEIDSLPFMRWFHTQRERLAAYLAEAQAMRAAAKLTPGNLPTPLTPLIGRAVELAKLEHHFQHTIYRCTSLVGPGGIGKTRLAYALGARLQGHFPDGIWLIELSGLAPAAPDESAERVADRLATAIAQALQITFMGTLPLATQVANHLRTKTTLLILDSFESLLTAAAWLPTLMATATGVHLLVTTRHRLPMQNQFVYIVEGLGVPPEEADERSADHLLTQYAGLQLFVERAESAGINLPLERASLATISRLCRFVDGSPWAIEIAVALLHQYGPAALLAAIQANYRTLTSKLVDLPLRQRSAAAVFQTSWDLLTPAEAQTLACCAVFRGGFTLTALQAIGEMTLDDLQALLHKSLIQAVGADHFALHELVRQFAAEQLAKLSAVQATVQARHAAYYLEFAQAQEGALLCDFAAQEAIHRKLDNLRRAWQWSAAQGEVALLTKGASSLFTFYRLTGLYHEAIQQLESAIKGIRCGHAVTPTDTPAQWLLARLSVVAADFYRRTGALASSAQAASEALTLGRQLAAPALQGAALHELARLAQVRGDFHTMQSLAEAGCTQARLAGNDGLLAECLNAVGWALYSQQEPVAAIPYFQAALDTLTDAPNFHLEGRIRANLGQSYLATRAYVLAQHHFAAALVVQERLRDQEEILLTRFMLGKLWTAVGDYAAAQMEFTVANNLVQLTANPYWLCWSQLCYGRWQQRYGDLSGAQMTLTLARQTAKQSENRAFEHAALLELGALFLAQEEWTAAQSCYIESLTLQTVNIQRADAQAGLALCALATGQPAVATAYVDNALDLLARQGTLAARDLFQIYWSCLRVLQATADPRANDLLQTASELLRQDAAQFSDEAQRHRFLACVPAQRALWASALAADLA